MSVIAVANPKGGVGKTTVSLNLAVTLQHLGYSVALIDMDSQRSLSDWIQRRPTTLPHLNCRSAVSGGPQHNDIAQVTILDCPAHMDTQLLADWLPFLSAWVVPTLATPVDRAALTRHLFHLANCLPELPVRKMGLVVNKVRSGVKLQQQIKSRFGDWSLPIVAELRDTVNYTWSSYEGMAVTELPRARVKPDYDAQLALCHWVEQLLLDKDVCKVS